MVEQREQTAQPTTEKNGGRPRPVPGVLPVLPEEIDHYEEQVRKFRAGEADPQGFRAFRLRHGVYGQRQPGVQMFRIKIPFGRLTPTQLEAIGRVARDYSELGRGHITTRENIQLHFTQLDNTAEMMRVLGDAGLVTREACGNTVRNVTGCPLAGVCPTEPFDVSPYAAAYARFLVRHPVTQNMPRKFKTAFSGCAHDCAITPIHDLGFIAQVREENGTLRKGFKVVVGGGLSIEPCYAQTLYEFVPVEDYLRVAEAVVRIFDRQEDLRKNRMKARIKVLIKRIGIDAFRQMVEEELKGEWARKEYDLGYWALVEDETAFLNPPRDGWAPAPEGDGDFRRWRETNVVPQKQEGFCAVFLKLKVGNLTAEQFFALADIVRRYIGDGPFIRTTQRQDLVLRWVREECLYDLYRELKALDLAEPGVNEITDVVSCPGTESCSLGITSSLMLGAHLTDYLKGLGIDDPLVRQIRINISGCPDGCGQHHVGHIGFHGAAIKNTSGFVPAYEVYVGGSQVAPIRLGFHLKTKVPAKRVPEAIKAIIDYYLAHRREGEPFPEFVDRVGPQAFEEVLRPLSEVPPLGKETIDYYIDYGRTVLYKVQRGEGECAV